MYSPHVKEEICRFIENLIMIKVGLMIFRKKVVYEKY